MTFRKQGQVQFTKARIGSYHRFMDGVLPNNPIDRSRAKLYPLTQRPNKASGDDFAGILDPNPTILALIDSLPDIFKGSDLKQLLDWCVKANQNKKAVFAGMGAHVIKVGMAPLLIRLLETDMLQGLVVHGASSVHDLEIAMIGQTSEDVAAGLQDGSFGMVEETGATLFKALAENEGGYGYRLGKYIEENDFPYKHLSLFAACYRLNKPMTVHVGIGTDIVHQHPAADGRLLGEASYIDFETLAENLQYMDDGGGFLNLGSAVLVPEVFLKALTMARNIHKKPYHFFTANFDQIEHYRPRVNIIHRPTIDSRYRGLHFSGHHEIMLPLFLNAWYAKLQELIP